MGKNIFEIVERLKKLKGLKTDGEAASALKMSLGALSNHKTRRSIPYDALSTFCDIKGISFDWLLTGEGKPEQGKDNLTVSESQVIYNVSEDSELEEILKWLKDNPQDKKLVLKLIKGRKYTKEALEGFNIQNSLNEEGT